jgi:Family of unknown function (DUF6152)
MMNKKLFAIFLSIAFLIAAIPAVAHHSTAHYLFNMPAEMSGTVKSISVANPHLKLILIVNDKKGMHEVEFEGHSLNHYYRAGWRVGKIVEGDKINIVYSPRKDGEDGGYITGLQTAKGEWIRVGLPPA